MGSGEAIKQATSAAGPSTTGIVVVAADEVSAAIAQLFGSHAQDFQALSAKAAAFHAQFVQAMGSASAAYTAAEVANASPLQGLQDLLSPWQALTGRPLFGDGADAAASSGLAGPATAGGFGVTASTVVWHHRCQWWGGRGRAD